MKPIIFSTLFLKSVFAHTIPLRSWRLKLEKGGYAVRTGIGGTGVIGELAGTLPGPVVGLRADMDALIHTVDGVEKCIHSCGHDAHSAMVITAAQVLSTARLGAER